MKPLPNLISLTSPAVPLWKVYYWDSDAIIFEPVLTLAIVEHYAEPSNDEIEDSDLVTIKGRQWKPEKMILPLTYDVVSGIEEFWDEEVDNLLGYVVSPMSQDEARTFFKDQIERLVKKKSK